MRRARRIALIAIATIVLLEVSLQILAVGFWLFAAKPQVTAEAGRSVVYCVGDSFTAGLGASSREESYPAQLERHLRAKLGDTWSVANGGFPGNSSREVLGELDARIDTIEPTVVCVVVGANDDWKLPEPLSLEDHDASEWVAPGDFRFECRILRLLRTARSRRPFVTSNEATDSKDPGPRTTTSEQPPPDMPKPKRAPIETGHPRDRNNELFGFERSARTALGAGDLATAERDTQRLLDAVGPDSELAAIAWRLLAQVLSKRNEKPGVDEALATLRRMANARERARIAEETVDAWFESGREQEALALARQHAPRFADSARLHDKRAFLELQHGDPAAARQASDRAIATGDPTDRGRYRGYLRTRFRVYQKHDKDVALDALLRAHELGSTEADTRMLLQFVVWDYDRAAFEQRVARVVESERARRELVRVYESIVDLDETQRRKESVYRTHLEQVIWRCRRTGAKVVFASYPHQQRSWYRRLAATIADETGVAWVDTADALALRIRAEPDADFFVADGHCNDAGYGVMAEAIGNTIVTITR